MVARASLTKLCSAMKQISNNKFEAFEQASRELSVRHKQVQSLILRIENFQKHHASWTEERQELEREKLKLHLRVVSLERGLDGKSTQIDQQTHKLKDLMRTITLQDERLQKKQRFIEEKASELALYEQNVRKESDSNSKLHELAQNERNAVKSLQKELEDHSQKQEMKERELFLNEQRLFDMERNIKAEHEKSQAGQQRMKELATQLQKRHDEVTRQRQDLEERQQKCNKYETRLRSWEEELEHATMERNLKDEKEKSNVDQDRINAFAAQLQQQQDAVARQRQELEEREQKCDKYEARLRSWEGQLEHITTVLQGNSQPPPMQAHNNPGSDSLQHFGDRSVS